MRSSRKRRQASAPEWAARTGWTGWWRTGCLAARRRRPRRAGLAAAASGAAATWPRSAARGCRRSGACCPPGLSASPARPAHTLRIRFHDTLILPGPSASPARPAHTLRTSFKHLIRPGPSAAPARPDHTLSMRYYVLKQLDVKFSLCHNCQLQERFRSDHGSNDFSEHTRSVLTPKHDAVYRTARERTAGQPAKQGDQRKLRTVMPRKP